MYRIKDKKKSSIGIYGKKYFPNGYGVSVIFFRSQGERVYDEKNKPYYELAIINDLGNITSHPLGDEEIFICNEEEVKQIIEKVKRFSTHPHYY